MALAVRRFPPVSLWEGPARFYIAEGNQSSFEYHPERSMGIGIAGPLP